MSDVYSDYHTQRHDHLVAKAVNAQNDPSQGPTSPNQDDLDWEDDARYRTTRSMPASVIGEVLEPGRRVEAGYFHPDPTTSAAILAALVSDGSVADLEA